jgi:glycerol-3-phosphate cytidylyltransferase-like family protein
MGIYERVLNLLAMRIVDDIVFDAPFVTTKEMINHMNIDQGIGNKGLIVSC